MRFIPLKLHGSCWVFFVLLAPLSNIERTLQESFRENVRPSKRLLVIVSPPKPLDEIQPKGYLHLCPRMDFL